MKYLFFTLMISSFFSFSQSEETKIKNDYISFLKSEGFTPSIDNDGDIKFKFEGKTYWINSNDDELFFSVSRYVGNSDEGCSNKMKKVVKESDNQYKSLNVEILGSDCQTIKFSSSSLLAQPEDFKVIFERSLRIVNYGVNFSKEEYQKISN